MSHSSQRSYQNPSTSLVIFNPITRQIVISTLMVSALWCATTGCQRDTEESEPLKSETVTVAAQLQAVATQMNISARDLETTVTPLLQKLSAQHLGRMRGLKHRLKTLSSAVRKLTKEHKEHPALSPNELKISDMLRYTIEISDTPPGHHVKAIHETLRALEAVGFKVVKVKNYWPRGDNYSGVNSVIKSAEGFEWELQFHTPASYKEKSKSHVTYQLLRDRENPLTVRQKAFQKLAAPWEEIAVPQDILKPLNLHALETIKSWEAPTQ